MSSVFVLQIPLLSVLTYLDFLSVMHGPSRVAQKRTVIITVAGLLQTRCK